MYSSLRMIPLVAVVAALSLASSASYAAPPSDAGVTAKAVDNTAVNVRDRTSATVTPIDQPNNKQDIGVAAGVRRSLTNEHSLSTMAHNVKLVASAGVVTLRGPVASESEKAKVEQLAAASPGVSSVRNELDVKQ
jgi:hyperosmotically inducible periplasmic protein